MTLEQRISNLCKQSGCKDFKEYSLKHKLLTYRKVGNLISGYSIVASRDIIKTLKHIYGN